MLKTIFFLFFKPAIKLIGKISYLSKIILILVFLALPLLYSISLVHKSFQEDFTKIDAGLKDLQRNELFYRMIFLADEFQTSALRHLAAQDSNESQSELKKNEKRLYEADANLPVCMDESVQENCEHYYQKFQLALLNQDREKLLADIQAYKYFLYDNIVELQLGSGSSPGLSLDNIAYLLSVELPLNTLLGVEIKNVHDDNELPIQIGKFQGSVEKTDSLLQSLAIYENRLKELNGKYKKTVRQYIDYLLADDFRRADEILDSLLSLQLSLFNVLENILENTLQKQRQVLQNQYYIFIFFIICSVFLGLYLFIGAYLSLSLSLKQFFDTTADISRGELGSRVVLDTDDEMGLLSFELNKMIESLDYHYALLAEYKKAVDCSAIVVKTDLGGTITYVNKAFEKISAYTKEELIGSSHRLVQSKNTTNAQIEELWKCILDKKVYKTVFENMAKNGKVFYVETTIVPIVDSAGEISEFISIMFDITPLYKQKEKLQSQLYKDELTSLPNRLKLIEDIAITKEPKLVVINIDGFKEINTIFGESIGDLALQQMTEKIKSSLKTRHLQLYKLSADEFAILADKDITIYNFREDVMMLSHYLSHIKLECGEHQISVRLSLGAAISELHHSQRPLISMADMALKEAKRKMRPYLFYHDITSVDEDLEKNYEMVQLIEQAIKEDKVKCCYQGIVNAKTGEIEKYETLMRLEDENGKNVSPQNFVGIAKRARYYPVLTQKVVQEAIFTFMKRGESVSINLSIDDIMDDDTYQLILDVLRKCGCADRVVFEFLESEEIEFNERIFEFTSQVKKMGSQIAIDDFGSGYSNYAYLMKLGVDILKIDASLIKDIDTNENSRLITQSIIDIAHALGMKTVAEHVHTKEVEERIKSMGVDYLQGYYLHKPVSEL